MKRREYDAVAADIAMLEANYNAQLAKYLYEKETITGEEFMQILNRKEISGEQIKTESED